MFSKWYSFIFVFFTFDNCLQKPNLYIIHISIKNFFIGFFFLHYFMFILFIDLFQGHLFFSFYNINVILIYLFFINLYTSFSMVIMTQNYYKQIISGHNNFVFWSGHHINMTMVNIEVCTSLFQQLSRYGYIREIVFSRIFKMKTNKNH